jgi:actin cytoskeleton-regulatory complex protein PAN1
MYSSSNSFLGGANSARQGQQQASPFGQPPPQQQQQQQLQPGFAQPGLAAQPTGFPGGQLQAQYTGFPGAGAAAPQPGFQSYGQPSLQPPQSHLQPQFTSFPAQNQQLSAAQPPQQQLQQPAAPSQQFPNAPSPLPSIAVHKTSAQVAQSFQNIDSPSSRPPLPPKTGSRIPNIRLSFITAQDQAKFEQLFKAAAGEGQTLDGSFLILNVLGLHD